MPVPYREGPGSDAIHLIDVLWIERDSSRVAAAFEVQHTTSIYSGIVRLLDLAPGAGAGTAHGLFLVAPDTREGDVRAQLARPAFQRIGELAVRFLPYSALAEHREVMSLVGTGLKAIEAKAATRRVLVRPRAVDTEQRCDAVFLFGPDSPSAIACLTGSQPASARGFAVRHWAQCLGV